MQSSVSTGATAVTPSYTNTKTVAFYINKSGAAGAVITYDLQFSSDGGTNWYTITAGTNTINGESITATIPTLPTTVGVAGWSLVTATFNTNHQLDATPTNSSFKFRIRDTRASGVAGTLWVDDFSIMTYNTSPNDNTIVVPMLNQASACTVTVPASGNLNFYDQGGLNDNYNKSQTQYIYFQPTNATDKVRITFQNTFALDAASNITVYNGNGTGGTVLLNAYTNTTTLPSTTVYTSSSSDGNISIKFVSSTTSPLAGFDIKVECIGNLAITSLGSTSGCPGSQLVINGSGFTGTTAANVTIGGTAVSSIVSNTGTVLTVIPATGSSGTVSVTNGTTVTYGTYTVNAVPVITSVAMGSQTVCSGITATALSISATAGSGSISSYQWYSNTSASTSGGTLLTGANAATYTPSSAVVGTLYYYCVVTNSNGCSATSAVSGAVTVTSPPTTSTNGGNLSACKGTTTTGLGGNTPSVGTGTWTCTAAPAGGSTSDITFTSATTPNTTAIVSASATAGAYTLTWTIASAGCTSSTSTLTLTVNAAPTITSVAMSGQSACTSGTLTALSISATSGSGSISTYQWYSNTTASTSGGTIISGANAASYTPSSASAGTLYYYCVVTNSVTCSATSAVSGAIVVSNSATAPTAIAATAIGGTSFTANWNAVSGATGYYLDVSTSNTFATFVTGYNNLSVGNVTTYAVSGLTQNVTYYYRVRAVNACSTSTSSNTINLTTVSLSYCVPTYATGPALGDQITNVTLGTLNNTSGASTTPFYTFYNSVTIPNLYQGNNATISVSFGTDSRQFVGVWIDYNQNGTFEASEGVVSVNSAGSSGTVSLTLPVPAGALLGNTRMRVRGGDDAALLTSQACGATNSVYGETEDYIVNIIVVPPCTVSLPTSLVTSYITATTATLSWSDASFAPSSVYNYYISTSSTPPTAGTTPTGTVTGVTSVNLTGLTLGLTYYCWVRTNCSGSTSSWSVSTNFTTVTLDVVVLNGSSTGGTTTTCNGKFYDSGNATGSYSNSESYTYTFVPATSGSKLKAVFNSFAVENSYDYLSIYSGTTVTPANLIGTYTGAQIAAGTAFYSTAAGGELTFKFTSDGSVVYSGWDVSLSCVLVPTITSFTPTSACSGSTPTVTITGTNFTGATTVSFNGTPVTPTSVTATQIVVTLPAAATTGYISVTTPTASGTSSSMFYIKPIPNTPNAGVDKIICQGNSAALSATGSIGSQVIVQNNCSSFSAWTTNDTSRWTIVTSNNASGSTGGEMRFHWLTTSTLDDTVQLAQMINTTGYTGLNFSFRHMLDWFTGTFSLYMETSPDGTNWTTRWTVSPTADIAASGVSIDLSALDGTSFYVRFRFSGNTWNINDWYIDDVTLTGNPTLSYTWSTSATLSPVVATTQGTSVSPTTTTTYYVASTLNGCNSATDNVLVTVNAKPTGVVSGSTSVCSGATATVSITLTGTAPWNLTYSNGSTSTSVTGITTSPYTFTTPAITATTTYTLTALSDASCSAVAGGMTGSAVISLSTPPTITIASAVAPVCYSNSNQNTTLAYTATSGSIASYSVVWNTAPFIGTQMNTNATFPGSSPLTITVPGGADNTVTNTALLTVTNSNGCVSAAYQFSVTINTSPAVTMTANSRTICYDASNAQTVSYNYTSANTLNSYDVTWNATPANSLPTISNAPFTTSSGTISITVPAGTAGGTYTGTVTPKNASCGNGASPRTITLIVSAPSITPSASPVQVCYSASSQTANLTYTNATATPTTYSIVWSATPTNSFTNVTNAAITASPIVLSIPAGTAINTYTGTITVKNANGCTSPSSSFSVNVNGIPTMTASSAVTAVCTSTSAQTSGLSYTATTYSPTSYSIDWNAAANTAGLSDQSSTTFTFGAGSGTINTIAIPANITAGTYSGTITISSAATCASSYPITIGIGKKWAGTVSSDWTNASNWTPSGEPTTSDYCVVIPSGTPNNPVIASAANCGNLTINSGATLTVNAGYSLTVQDYVKTDGTLTINNGGSLVQVNNVANSGTGSMVYKRDVSGLKGYDYIYWSSPVASQNIATLYSSPTPGGMYYWDVLANNGNGTGGNTSQGNWANASGAMQVGKGYIIRASNSYSWTGSLTSTFTGIPNNGTLTYPLYRGVYQGAATYIGNNGSVIGQWDDNYNLIGNPYPSAIDAISFLNDTANSSKIQGYVYLWTHGTVPSSSVNNPFYGSYSVNYNLSDYIVYNSLGTSTPTGFNGKIAAGQGFYVALNDGATVTDASQPITFKNTMRSASYNNTQFYKNNASATSADSETHRIWIDFIDTNHSSTSTLVGYATNASNGVDRMYDAVTGIDGNVLYSIIDNQTYSIQGRAIPFDTEDRVSLGYHAATAGNFTIAISAVDGLFQQGQPIYLEDKLLNIIYDLRQAPYNFSTTEGIYNDRFVLRFTNSALSTYQIGNSNVAVSVNNNQLMVKANKEIDSIQVFDLTGKLVRVYNESIKTNDFKGEFVFEKGVYLAKIQLTDGTLVSQKIMN